MRRGERGVAFRLRLTPRCPFPEHARARSGVALGSGLLLELERAVALWAIFLLVLVVSEQALQGRLPDEIGGRRVRYVAQEQLDLVVQDSAETDGDFVARLEQLETAFAESSRSTDRY